MRPKNSNSTAKSLSLSPRVESRPNTMDSNSDKVASAPLLLTATSSESPENDSNQLLPIFNQNEMPKQSQGQHHQIDIAINDARINSSTNTNANTNDNNSQSIKVISWNVWCVPFDSRNTLSNPDRCGRYLARLAKYYNWDSLSNNNHPKIESKENSDSSNGDNTSNTDAIPRELIFVGVQELWSFPTGIIPAFLMDYVISKFEYIPYIGHYISLLFQVICTIFVVLTIPFCKCKIFCCYHKYIKENIFQLDPKKRFYYHIKDWLPYCYYTNSIPSGIKDFKMLDNGLAFYCNIKANIYGFKSFDVATKTDKLSDKGFQYFYFDKIFTKNKTRQNSNWNDSNPSSSKSSLNPSIANASIRIENINTNNNSKDNLLVINTHLQADGEGMERVEQLKQLSQFIKNGRKKYDDNLNVIVVGDFNIDLQSHLERIHICLKSDDNNCNDYNDILNSNKDILSEIDFTKLPHNYWNDIEKIQYEKEKYERKMIKQQRQLLLYRKPNIIHGGNHDGDGQRLKTKNLKKKQDIGHNIGKSQLNSIANDEDIKIDIDDENININGDNQDSINENNENNDKHHVVPEQAQADMGTMMEIAAHTDGKSNTKEDKDKLEENNGIWSSRPPSLTKQISVLNKKWHNIVGLVTDNTDLIELNITEIIERITSFQRYYENIEYYLSNNLEKINWYTCTFKTSENHENLDHVFVNFKAKLDQNCSVTNQLFNTKRGILSDHKMVVTSFKI